MMTISISRECAFIVHDLLQARSAATNPITVFFQKQRHSPRQSLPRSGISDNSSTESQSQCFSEVNLPVVRRDCGTVSAVTEFESACWVA